MMWRGCVCLVYFSFSLNTDSKSSLLMYHVNWQSAPTFSWFLFLRCHLLQNHRNKLEGECLNHFFSLFTFALLSSSLKRSPSQSCYYVNQLRIVSHFCLPGDRCWASWKCKCKYISYSVSKAHFHHILLTFSLVCLLIIFLYAQKWNWSAPPPTNCFYQIFTRS